MMPVHSRFNSILSRTGLRFLCFLLAITLGSSFSGYAQTIRAAASVDTNAILIGQQFVYSLEVNHPSDIRVEWPALADTFARFEVVKRSQVDTTVQSGERTVTKRQHFKVTSFDSGYHVIPPMTFHYRLPGDTSIQKAETEPVLITVTSVPVDTTRAIKDIKGQIVLPLSWKDFLPYVFGIAGLILVSLLIYYFYIKFRPLKQQPDLHLPKRPAHEIGIEQLERLEAQKLWQQGNHKGYYTGLSDIIRTFIENRWSVAAMEMTTDEILRLKIISEQPPELLDPLRNLLQLADLVKFAKALPIHHENEQSLKTAYSFVGANRTISETKEVLA